MKKSMRKMLVLMLTVLMMLTLYTIPAFAQSTTASAQSGVTVTVVPDKTQYSATENIVVTLTVTNNSGAEISNVSLQQVVPKGYTVDQNKAIKTVGTLKNGESQSLKVTLIPNNSPSTRPKTGDTTKTIILLVILAVAVIAAIVCLVFLLKGKKGSKGTRALSLILVLAMTASLLPAIGSSTAVSAAETTGSPASGTATVTVDGQTVTLVGYAYYTDGTQSAVTLGTLAVDKDHIEIGNEGQIHFYLRVTGAPESVGLYNAKGEKVADLNDKGTNGDKQAGDGVYSVDRKLVSNQAGTATFYVGSGDQKSNTVTITFYKKQQPDTTYTCTVKGYIYDAKTNAPIKTATISVYSGTTLINTTTIAEANQGYYTIKVPNGTYNVIIESTGYRSQGATGLSITGDKTLPSLGLVPKEEEAKMGAVTGTITDVDGANIAGAQVDIYQVVEGEEKSVVTLITGEDGYYYTSLEVGSYTVRVSMDGYNGDSRIITIGSEGAQVDGSFVLISAESQDDTEEPYIYAVRLKWNALPEDLDLHVVKVTDGSIVYDVSCDTVDVEGECKIVQSEQNGYGPEAASLNMDASSSYYFYVFNYSQDAALSESGAVIELYKGGELIETCTLSSVSDGNYWNAFAVINGEIVECNTITGSQDTSYTTTPVETTTEAPTETTTEAPAETTTVTEAPAEATTVTEAPAEAATVTEAPAEAATVTEAPVETTTDVQAEQAAPVDAAPADEVTYEYKATLSWNEIPQDLDLHVVAVCNGQVVYDVPDPTHNSVDGCMRDGDVNTGYGPEIVEFNMVEGYNYYFYAKQYDPADGTLASSGACITLTDNGNEYYTCNFNASGSGTVWNAFAIIDGTVVECNTITDVADTYYVSTPSAEAEETPAPTDQAATDQAATDQAATDQAATDQAATDQAATDQAAADQSSDEDITVWVESEGTYDAGSDTVADAGSSDESTWDEGAVTDESGVDSAPAEESADSYTDQGSASDLSYVQGNWCLYVGVLDPDGTLVSDGTYMGDDASDLQEFADKLGVGTSVRAYTSKDEMISDLKNKNIDIIWSGLDNTDITMNMSIAIYHKDGSCWDCYDSSWPADGVSSVSNEGRFYGLRNGSDLDAYSYLWEAVK